MAKKTIISILAKKIGLSEKAIASDQVEKAFQKRMSAVNITEIADYAQFLSTDQDELDQLIELLVVTETWFFRNEASFDFLKNYVKALSTDLNNGKKIRILSIPCSTGEEPYSIVMTLLNTGIKESDFHVDAIDISERVLRLAGTGIYSQGAFRGKMIEYHRHFFRKTDDYYKIFTSVKSNVHFIKGNLLNEKLLENTPCYDIIFCRNLLIYFSDSAKKIAVNNIDRLLSPEGLLFLGHAEDEPLRNSGFEWIAPPRAFVCRRKNIFQKIQDIQPDIEQGNKLDKQPSFKSNDIFGLCPDSQDMPENKCQAAHEPKLNSMCTAKDKVEEDLTKQLKSLPPVKLERNLLETAQLLADQGALDEAFKKCNEFLEKHPAHVHAHFLLGMIYQSVENYKEAEKYMNKTIYLDPYHCDAMEQLALIAEHRHDFAKSKQLRLRIRRIIERKEKQ